ncbi:MAG: hypothetical protein C7B46_00765 [Sulfobacillus benefaciens]|uniref:DUF1643 domain-containing protein n=1 Tax=Sulfobacillus benefaciens TaxID=453960 RepID=A0A2T2XM42_9FIRM|nr:MAG: hypothetical protein C7B46_00765 [Sulfobacillus benefaciens]
MNLDSPPYILDNDEACVATIQDNWTKSKSQNKEDLTLHLELFPEPFIGRVDAPIVLLNLNPGFDVQSDPDWHRKSIMREAVADNLSRRAQEYPFYLLRPDFVGSAIAKWWRTLLAPWIADHPDNLKQVARSVLAVELFPYHSKKYGRYRARDAIVCL